MKQELDAGYWSKRYQDRETGWDVGEASAPLAAYIDQLNSKDLRILIPGAGRAWEAEYLLRKGFKQVYVCDLAAEPLQHLARRCPGLDPAQLLQSDFFELEEGRYDLVLEQTFFCAIDPALRQAYADKVWRLLKPGGRLVGLLFNTTFEQPGPPFGGSAAEYRAYFQNHFRFHAFDTAYNSIAPRAGRELFINLQREP